MAFYQLVLRIYLKFVLEYKQQVAFFQSDAIIPLQTKRAQGGRETHDGILLLFLSDMEFVFVFMYSFCESLHLRIGPHTLTLCCFCLPLPA